MKNRNLKIKIFLAALAFSLPGSLAYAQWTAFNSPTGYYSASFPTAPVQSEKSDKSIVGTIAENIARSQGPTGDFTVEYSHLPGIAVALGGHEEIFKKAKDGFLKQTGAQELGYTDITLGGNSGKELSFQNASGQKGKVRMFLAGKRFYFLSATSPQGDAPVSQFLNSFQILPAPGK